MKYHITPDGPQKCTDQNGRCPYYKKSEPHFNNETDAQNFYTKRMEETHGTISSHKKQPETRTKLNSINLVKIDPNDPIYNKVKIAKIFAKSLTNSTIDNKLSPISDTHVSKMIQVSKAFA